MTVEGLRHSVASDPNHVLVREQVEGEEFIPHGTIELEGIGLVPETCKKDVPRSMIVNELPPSTIGTTPPENAEFSDPEAMSSMEEEVASRAGELALQGV